MLALATPVQALFARADDGGYASTRERYAGLTRLKLFKEVESASGQVFVDGLRSKEKGERLAKAEKIALNSNFEGIEDFSEEYYWGLDVAISRQRLCRQYTRCAIKQEAHGLCAFDATLLHHSTLISDLYDDWYLAWSKAVQGNAVADKLTKDGLKPSEKHLENHYTIIQLDAATGAFYDVPYYTFFERELRPICAAFDSAIAALLPKAALKGQKSMVAFLKHYRASLACTERTKLEAMWTELDVLWMKCKYWIHIVHDIEDGYGDPLRIKAIPDFSFRFEDEDYHEDNKTIVAIQKVMVDEYFAKRDTPLSKAGLGALASSAAAIFYIPFVTGMSLHFRFSGQSIPNRSDVKNEHGVKIYFDPVSTHSRQLQTAALIDKVCDDGDGSLKATLGAADTLVWHVAAHEVGHAIYNLEAMCNDSCSVIKTATKSLLEEPRAELTALRTMSLLVEVGMLTPDQAAHHLASFALQDLRRFAMFDAQPTRPYTISAINTYKVYQRTGFVTVDSASSKLRFDFSKGMDALKELGGQFERILDAEDEADGAALEAICEEFQTESDLTRMLVAALK